MYTHEIARMLAEPNGAADTAPTGRPAEASGWAGRNAARWARTATGPTPGPPPPWGMQNVLCRLRWLTSAPNLPGWARPTIALRLAPSTYTCPPWRWTISHSSPMPASNTPCVDGYVTIAAARASPAAAALASRSSRSTLPCVVAAHDDHLQAGHHRARGVGAVGARRDQAHVAAGVAAAAVVGADGQQAGELALAAGVGLQADRVVAGDGHQHLPRAGRSSARMPIVDSSGVNGCMSARPGHVIGSISTVALSFIVHEPSGIIVRSRARSLSARRRR